MMNSTPFLDAFRKNFYLSEHFALFCQNITGRGVSRTEIAGTRVPVLKKLNVAVGAYSSEVRSQLRKHGISYMAVLPKINAKEKSPSLFEYAVLHKKSYDEAAGNYAKSFRTPLRNGKKYRHTMRIVRGVDEEILSRVFPIYETHMKRLNSWVFPRSLFEQYMAMPDSLLFLLEYEGEIVAYMFCCENAENLYCSFGGGNPLCYQYKGTNKVYDELIRYACGKGLNVHLGFGVKGAGYNVFKEKAGAVNYKCDRFPRRNRFFRSYLWLLNFKTTGRALRYLSGKYPRRIVYYAMPIT